MCLRRGLAAAHPLAVNLAAILVQLALHLLALAGGEVAAIGAALGPLLFFNAPVVGAQLAGLAVGELAIGAAGGNALALVIDALVYGLGVAGESQGQAAGKRQQELLHDERVKSK